MIRNDDLIRQMLFDAEAAPNWRILVPGLNLLNPTQEQTEEAYHLLLLVDAGLMTHHAGDTYRMTNAGHDFLQAIRDDTVWADTKSAAAKVGGVGLSMIGSIALGYVKQKLNEYGIPMN